MGIKEILYRFRPIEALSEPELNKLNSAVNLHIRQDGFDPQTFMEIIVGRAFIKENCRSLTTLGGEEFKYGIYYTGRLEGNSVPSVTRSQGIYSS